MRTRLLGLRPAVLSLTAAVALPLGLLAPLVAASPAGAASPRAHSTYRSLTTDADWAAGSGGGYRIAAGSLSISAPRTTRSLNGLAYDRSRWTSAWISPRQSFSQLISSWNALTPAGTWIEVQARTATTTGQLTRFKVLGTWATHDGPDLRRTSSTSATGQADSLVRVATDTLIAQPGVRLSRYQLRVVMLRRSGTTATPTVRDLGAVVSADPTASRPTSRPLLPGRTLAVPAYSQMIHRGQYPQYGSGGEAWCSPTSLSMLLGYYHRLPSASTYRWVSGSYADRWVDHVARMTYDYGYRGTGNWPFNTAYAANYLPQAFVTRLDDLTQAERFIAAGIPLAASISFSRGGLSGAPISATNGHLVVISGFTSAGNVVVNDPAASSNAGVRRVYDRAQFERAWTGRSGGLVYVLRDAAHPLPARHGATNW